MNYQKLFNYFSEQHGIHFIETEMQEVCNIINELTPQPQPTMSAQEIIDKNTFVKDGLITVPNAIKCMEEYRNQPIEIDTNNKLAAEISQLSDAEFNNNADKLLKLVKPFTPPRNEQEEADRLHHELGHFKSIAVVEYTRDARQQRGLSTEFEEKVLTILKGK